MKRRDFIKNSLTAGVALIGPHARVLGANDDIRMGMVGIGSNVKIGGKGKKDIIDYCKIPGVRIVALCDCDADNLMPEVQKFKDRNEKVKAYTDVRELLNDKDIDAISIATPNHWHSLITIWACQAGKDVYVQKPASHNIFEGRKMVEAAKKYNRVVQAVHGPRSQTGIGEAFEYIRQGNLGKILYAQGINYKPRMSIGKVNGPQPIPKTVDYDLWSGPAPKVPLMRKYLHYDWHWDWLYGNGDIGNMGIHYMDACRWALGKNELPKLVMSIGGRFGYEDDGQTPNTLITFLDYEPAPIIFEVRGLPKNQSFRNSPWVKNKNISMDYYHGIRIGVVVHCEHGYVANNAAYDNNSRLIKKFEATNKDCKENFIDVVRSRKVSDLSTDVLEGHLSCALIHMANISFRLGKKASSGEIKEVIQGEKEFIESFELFQDHLSANGIDLEQNSVTLGPMLKMDPKKERFVGYLHEEANKLVSRDYRKPFVVPEKV